MSNVRILLARLAAHALALGALSAALSTTARAEQFVVTDVVYTHSAETTSDSHYRVNPAAGSPSNWKSPIDYSMGSAHVVLEVKSKPTATPTKFQICFEGTPSYGCTDQSPTYTAPGKYEWSTPFSSFYLGGQVDWSQGVKKVALILKDTQNNKPQGDPLYVPSDLHVEVVIVSKGASYVAPLRDAGVASDAGALLDAGARDAGARDAGARDAAASDARSPEASAPAEPAQDASSDTDATSTEPAEPTPGTDAGAALDSGGSAGENTGEQASDKQGGCSLKNPSDNSFGAWLLLSAFLLSKARAQRRVSRRRRRAR